MQSVSFGDAQTAWDKFLDEARSDAFKVEVLQDYAKIDGDAPSLRAWLNGDKTLAIKLLDEHELNAWQIRYRDVPIRKIRLHVIETPLSPYMEWEVELYKRVLAPRVGEEIALVYSEALTSDIRLPDGDFWMFDERRVVKWNYSDGLVVGGDIYDEATGDDITPWLALKESLLLLMEPLHGNTATHGQRS